MSNTNTQGRPKYSTDNRKMISLRVDPKTKTRLKEMAIELHMSQSEVLDYLIGTGVQL